jgi:hypothetical protein
MSSGFSLSYSDSLPVLLPVHRGREMYRHNYLLMAGEANPPEARGASRTLGGEARWSSDLTALNKSHHPPLVIPSAAEGPAVRPGFLTKVSVPLVLPQNRHPERSALQLDRVTQRLWRGVEGPRRCLVSPMLFGAFQPPSAHRAGPASGFFSGQIGTTLVQRPCRGLGMEDDPVVGPRWSKSSEQHGQTKHRRGPSTPRHKRCVTR